MTIIHLLNLLIRKEMKNLTVFQNLSKLLFEWIKEEEEKNKEMEMLIENKKENQLNDNLETVFSLLLSLFNYSTKNLFLHFFKEDKNRILILKSLDFFVDSIHLILSIFVKNKKEKKIELIFNENENFPKMEKKEFLDENFLSFDDLEFFIVSSATENISKSKYLMRPKIINLLNFLGNLNVERKRGKEISLKIEEIFSKNEKIPQLFLKNLLIYYFKCGESKTEQFEKSFHIAMICIDQEKSSHNFEFFNKENKQVSIFYSLTHINNVIKKSQTQEISVKLHYLTLSMKLCSAFLDFDRQKMIDNCCNPLFDLFCFNFNFCFHLIENLKKNFKSNNPKHLDYSKFINGCLLISPHLINFLLTSKDELSKFSQHKISNIFLESER